MSQMQIRSIANGAVCFTEKAGSSRWGATGCIEGNARGVIFEEMAGKGLRNRGSRSVFTIKWIQCPKIFV